MRDFNWYVGTAKAKNNITSNNKLAIAIGISGSALSFMVKGHSNPADETMIKLAKLAGVEPSIALVERSLWMSSGEPKKAYAKILQSLQHVAMIVLFVTVSFTGFSSHSFASDLSSNNENNIYYGK